MEFGKLVADKKKEVEGVWVDVFEDCKLRVARLGNPEYKNAIQRLQRPHRRMLRRDTVEANRLMEDLVRQAIAETVLLDWKGIEKDDKSIEYSVENALALMRESDEFADIVLDYARSLELFQEEEKEGASKNL